MQYPVNVINHFQIEQISFAAHAIQCLLSVHHRIIFSCSIYDKCHCISIVTGCALITNCATTDKTCQYRVTYSKHVLFVTDIFFSFDIINEFRVTLRQLKSLFLVIIPKIRYFSIYFFQIPFHTIIELQLERTVNCIKGNLHSATLYIICIEQKKKTGNKNKKIY